MMQQPDNKPGNYYVSVMRDGASWRPLLGPFENDHAAALGWVDAVRKKAEDLDPRACWYSFGTVRLEPDAAAPAGMLNKFFPEAFNLKEAA
jgi:hypothetical protein